MFKIHHKEISKESKISNLNLACSDKVYHSNTTSPALSGGKLDHCASGIGLHIKWVRETLSYYCYIMCRISK